MVGLDSRAEQITMQGDTWGRQRAECFMIAAGCLVGLMWLILQTAFCPSLKTFWSKIYRVRTLLSVRACSSVNVWRMMSNTACARVTQLADRYKWFHVALTWFTFGHPSSKWLISVAVNVRNVHRATLSKVLWLAQKLRQLKELVTLRLR